MIDTSSKITAIICYPKTTSIPVFTDVIHLLLLYYYFHFVLQILDYW